jgi:3'-5' exoribonuclease 1
MLEKLELSFVGRPHSGLDDSKNIARIAQVMLKDGNPLYCNERILLNRKPSGCGIFLPIQNIKEEALHRKSGKAVSLKKTSDIEIGMASLTVNQSSSESEESDHEDLLAYYALQKS